MNPKRGGVVTQHAITSGSSGGQPPNQGNGGHYASSTISNSPRPNPLNKNQMASTHEKRDLNMHAKVAARIAQKNGGANHGAQQNPMQRVFSSQAFKSELASHAQAIKNKAQDRENTIIERQNTHQPFNQSDTRLLNNMSMRDLESAMVSRGTTNEFGAAFHSHNSQRPITTAAQHGSGKSSGNTVQINDLVPHDEHGHVSGSLQNTVMTHSHPHGNPLSLDDVQQAVIQDMEEIRAVSHNGTFSMQRPENGWGVNSTNDKDRRQFAVMTTSKALMQAVDKDHINESGRKGGNKLSRATIDTKGMQNYTDYRQHVTLEAFANNTGAKYEFPKQWAQDRRNSLDKKYPVKKQKKQQYW